MKSCILLFIISLYGVTGVEASYPFEEMFEGKVIDREGMCDGEGYYYNGACRSEDWMRNRIERDLATGQMIEEYRKADARGREKERLEKAQEKEKGKEYFRDICNRGAYVASLFNPIYGSLVQAAGDGFTGDKTALMGSLIELLPGMVAGNPGDNANSIIENLREEARRDLIREAFKDGRIP